MRDVPPAPTDTTLKLECNGTKIMYPVTRLHASATVQPSLHGVVSDTGTSTKKEVKSRKIHAYFKG